ncbi:hypothetical protein P8452_47355 [Trifolium repens]|nr:hypothetical protein P8452_47355 [Trifolium repens]
MKHKDGKLINQPNKNRSLTAAITIILLCGLSFYLGGDFKSGNSGVVDVINTIQKTLDSPKQSSGSFQIRPVNFSMHRSKEMEKRKECLFPPPPGYKPPIRWLKSRDECWYRNVPYNWINKQKSNQHWLRKEGERFLFPGCGMLLNKFLRWIWKWYKESLGDGTLVAVKKQLVQCITEINN